MKQVTGLKDVPKQALKIHRLTLSYKLKLICINLILVRLILVSSKF